MTSQMTSQMTLLRSLLLAYLLLSAVSPTLGFSGFPQRRVELKATKEQGTILYSCHTVSRRGMALISLLPILTVSQRCNAGFFGADDRRELNLCLVNLLRVQYWAESQSQDLQINFDNDDRVKQLYLEARLGAKAAVTGKVGGGATNRVYIIASLKFRETLEDLAWHASQSKNKRAIQLTDDLVEALASLVEFDGLDSTLDPSPRSSLMLTMFDTKKATFVKRMLAERIIPTARSLFNEFDPDVQNLCLNYVQSTYPNELPKKIEPIVVEAETTY